MAHGADVDGAAVAIRVHGHGRLAGVEVLGVGGQHLAALGLDQVAPEPGRMQVGGGKGAFEGEVVLFARRQRVELQHLQAEQVGQVMREAVVGRDVVFVHQAGVAGGHQRAAVLHVELEQVRLPAGQQVQRGGEDELVFGEVLGGAGEIDRDVAVVQGVVEQLEVLALR